MVEESIPIEKGIWGHFADIVFLYLERAAILGALYYAWKKTGAWELGVVSFAGGILMSMWIGTAMFPLTVQAYDDFLERIMTTPLRAKIIRVGIFVFAMAGNYWIISKTGDLIKRLAEGVG